MSSWKDRPRADKTSRPKKKSVPAKKVAEVPRKGSSWRNKKSVVETKKATEVVETKKITEVVAEETDINKEYDFDKNKTYLVVNGKAKEISKKSRYLLDMLIINQED